MRELATVTVTDSAESGPFTATTYTVEEMLVAVRLLATLDAPARHVPTVTARSVREATARVRPLLALHLDHTRPRRGAVSSLVTRSLLGVRDDDLRLALAWLDSAAVLLPEGD